MELALGDKIPRINSQLSYLLELNQIFKDYALTAVFLGPRSSIQRIVLHPSALSLLYLSIHKCREERVQRDEGPRNPPKLDYPTDSRVWGENFLFPLHLLLPFNTYVH